MTALLEDPTSWLALSLAIFFAFMWLVARKPIAAFFDSYAAKVKDELDEAARLRDEAAALLEKTRNCQHGNRLEAETLLKQAAEQAAALQKQAEKDIQASLARREKQAQDRIAAMQEQAAAEIRGAAVARALKASESLLQTHYSAADDAALIDRQIGKIAKAS